MDELNKEIDNLNLISNEILEKIREIKTMEEYLLLLIDIKILQIKKDINKLKYLNYIKI